jgi:preprotein translocase subunit SecE
LFAQATEALETSNMARKNDRKTNPDREVEPGVVATMPSPTEDNGSGVRGEQPARAIQAVGAERGPRRGFFDIYKPGQGYYTRLGTAVGVGALILWAAAHVYNRMSLFGSGVTMQYAQAGSAVLVILLAGLCAYWALALNRRVCDFLIATEGEMKKVSWTTRREILGSTRVVIVTVLILSAILFVVDVLLMLFFSEIKVLRMVPETITRLFGGSG